MHTLSSLRKVVFSVVALVLIWLFAEMFLAATGWWKNPSERFYSDIYSAAYEILPGEPLIFQGEVVPEWTNHAGFRGPEFSDKKPEGVYRIISTGDSTAHGSGVTDSETYARRLEVRLRGRYGPKFEVLNAAIPGTNIYSHRLQFGTKLVKYDPDLLILYVLFNGKNEFEVWRELEHKAARGEIDPVNETQRALHRSYVYRLMRRLIKGGERKEIESHIDAIRRRLAQRGPAWGSWVADGLREDLQGIIDIARRRGIKLLMAQSMHRDIVSAKAARARDPDLPYPAFERNFDDYLNAAREVCERNSAPFLDPNGAFVKATQAGGDLFQDIVHFTPEGHRVMSEAIEDFMRTHAEYFGLPEKRATAPIE